MITEVQFRIGTAADWQTANPVLRNDLIAFEFEAGSSSYRTKIGDGITHWNLLPYVSDASIVNSMMTWDLGTAP
jgi:hypothetical protein